MDQRIWNKRQRYIAFYKKFLAQVPGTFKKALSFLFPCLLFLFSCTERVDIELSASDDPMLVVFGEITNETKEHAVYLSQSVSYFYNQETPVVSGATVFISDGTDTVSLSEDSDEAGTYFTPDDFAAVPGKTYTLTIENVDIDNDGVSETYTAESEMKGTMKPDKVGVAYNSGWKGWEVGLFAREPGETTDYYLFKIYKNGVLDTDSISNYETAKDEFFNGTYLQGVTVQFFDEEEGASLKSGDVVTLEVCGITEAYYDFINDAQDEIEDKIPLFSGPSANVEGNISNGALGVFSVMSVAYGSCTYQGGASSD